MQKPNKIFFRSKVCYKQPSLLKLFCFRKVLNSRMFGQLILHLLLHMKEEEFTWTITNAVLPGNKFTIIRYWLTVLRLILCYIANFTHTNSCCELSGVYLGTKNNQVHKSLVYSLWITFRCRCILMWYLLW